MSQGSFFLDPVKWFQVLLSNTNRKICTQLNGSKCWKWLHISIWPLNETLTDTITLGQSGPHSNSNEGELYIQNWVLTIRGLSVISRATYCRWGSFNLFAEMQSAYSTAPVDWAVCIKGKFSAIVLTTCIYIFFFLFFFFFFLH